MGKKQPPEGPARSAFEQDYDRIIFSHPFRRLQDKTQVHPLPEHDFIHTRLTHSLEVSSVGRSLGRKAGEVILERHTLPERDASLFAFGAIVAAAALTHDLGNPPFGHAGEDAISDFFKHHPQGKSFEQHVSEAQWHDLTNFEGNAQGFRILNTNQYGLKLTYATLAAFMKYPCPALLPGRNKNLRSQKKYGFFQSEIPVWQEVATTLQLQTMPNGSWKRHPLAFLVEAADDICYSIIDLEDACSLGLVSFEETVELLANIIREDFKKDKLAQIPGQAEKIGALRALAISRLINECVTIFLDHEQEILNGTFDTALIEKCPSQQAVDEIIDISVKKIYRARPVVEIEAAGHEVLPGLLEEFTHLGQHIVQQTLSRKYQNLSLLLPQPMLAAITPETDIYAMLRLITDFVSGMTDKYAINLYQKIKGFKI